MSKKAYAQLIPTIFVFFLASALVFSFGLHSIQLNHTHPGHTHNSHVSQGSEEAPGGEVVSIDEYVHGTEKKFFIFILLTLLLGALVIQMSFQKWSNFIALAQIQGKHKKCKLIHPPSRYSYLVQCFSAGILNPKPY